MQQGMWEPAETLFLLSLVRPGMHFLDVGANVGYFSCLLARVIGSQGEVIAFEPEPENAFLLAANVELTRQLFPNAAPIRAFRCALSDRSGTARLQVYEKNLGLHSLVHASSGSRGVEVKTQRLDDLVFGTEPVITRRVDLIKADTQGSELMMMRGGEQLLRRDRPLLCLEFEPHLNGIDYSVELVRWLESMGYTSFRFFHANVSEPFTIVQELHLLENGDDIVARVRRKVVGPFGTLIAYPSEPMPDSQLPPVNAP